MNSTIFVQQGGNIQSVHRANRRAKPVNPAIVRPVNAPDGTQAVARIDDAHSQTTQPRSRAFNLEDYVAQIRKQQQLTAQSTTTARQSASVRHDDQNATTSAEVQAILDRIDRAHEEIARKNYRAAMTPARVAAAVPPTAASPVAPEKPKQITAPPLPVDPKPNKIPEAKPISDPEILKSLQSEPLNKEEILATVSAAIATVLTEIPAERLEQKLTAHLAASATSEGSSMSGRVVGSETQVERSDVPDVPLASPIKIDELKLQPVEPRPPIPAPHLSFPIPLQTDVEASKSVPLEISSSIAAWDVDSFRWPEVTEQILTAGAAAIGQLANYCNDILSPFGGTIAVTSPHRGKGSTTMAMSLARWSALQGKRVLLVDADLDNPALSRNVGLAPHLSWTEAARNSSPACETIIRSQDTQICLMPLSPILSRVVFPPHLFDSLAFLIAEVKHEFDLVVLDAGPHAQLLNELTRPNDLIDAVLLVDDDLHSLEFQQAKEQLIHQGVLKFVAAQNSARSAAA